MKKIVSLFIALSMFLGANALPQRQTKTVAEATPFTTVKQSTSTAAVNQLKQAYQGERPARPIVKKAHKATKGAQITIVATNLTEYLYGGYFPCVYGYNDAYYVDVTFWAAETHEEALGKYTNNDEDLEITVYDMPVDDESEPIYIEYTVAEFKRTADGEIFTATGTDDDGNEYDITLTFTAPETPNDTIRHTFATAEGDGYASEALYYAIAEDADYIATFALGNMLNIKPGIYDNSSFVMDYTAVYAVDDTDTTYLGNAYCAQLEVVDNGADYLGTFAYYASADSIYYLMTMPLPKHVPDADTVKYTFTEKAMVTYYGETGDYYLYVEDAKATMELDFFSNGRMKPGTYTVEDGNFDLTYCSAGVITGADTTTLYYRGLEVTISETVESFILIANFYAKNDNKIHQFTTVYMKPTPSKTEEYNFPDYTFVDYRDWDGSFDIKAAPADSSIVFSLEFISEEIAGKYTELDLSGKYTYIKIGSTYYNVEYTELTLTENADGSIYTAGEVLASNGTLYKLTIGEQGSAINQVDSATIQPKKIVRDGQVLILKNGEYYNLLGTKIE